MSGLLTACLTTITLAPALAEAQAEVLATELSSLSGLTVYPRSINATAHTLLFLGRRGVDKFLGILIDGRETNRAAPGFVGPSQEILVDGLRLTLTIVPANGVNAAVLRSMLPFLVAGPLGLRKSAGCGDRLGLATPGHIRAIRRAGLAPILAQQSIRENSRTGRTAQGVMDDVTWGVFQEGWRAGFGADADHLKTTHDIDICVAAGYTFYTIDPGEYVDNSANYAPVSELLEKIERLPWNVLASDPADTQRRLANQPLDLGQFSLTITIEELARAMAKYGRAVAHTVSMYRHLAEASPERPFELEMSVDETETVTTLTEHVYIAHELKRLGVKWVSLAPRYVGDFEKGVDYRGNLAEFEQSLARHVTVAQTYGPYKLSLHSGSDKFTIYPIVSRLAGELIHLKTAGTSYLEACRAAAALNPGLFRQLVAFAVERYPTDRATYHVSAEASKLPPLATWPDAQLPTLLDNFHARQIFHVTFGSVISQPSLGQPLLDTLQRHEESYYHLLEVHFGKHFAPFC